MKRTWLVVLLVIAVVAFAFIAQARTSYWGEYEAEASRELRDLGDAGLTDAISLAVDEIANDARWTGTRKEAHDLFRDFLATHVGITPPANWDAEVSDAQDAAVDFMAFMDGLVVDDQRLTQAAKDAILAYARANAAFEAVPIEE